MNYSFNTHIFLLLKNGILFLVSFFVLYSGVFGSFEIIELMPNTTDDKNLEYIKIKNISEESQNLQAYYLEDASGKQYVFGNKELRSGESKSFYRPETKIILNNSNEEVFLYNSGSVLIDEVSYGSSIKGEAIIFGEEDEPELEEDNMEEETGTGEILEFPEVIFSLQRPSYIFESENNDEYICDGEQDQCKVNFDLRESFSTSFPEKDYECEISFGSGRVTDEDSKCNPNTVVFPKGEYEVVFKIFHKDDTSIYSEKYIKIVNSDELFETYTSKYNNDITILRPEIIVQSGLMGEGRYFYCEKTECKINLKYEKRHEDEECRWKFYPGAYESQTTRSRCNPGYVTFPEGIFELSLQVYEDGNRNNSKKLKFYIYNTQDTRDYLVKKEREEKEKQKNFVRKVGEGNHIVEERIEVKDIKGDIVLQGKLGKEKMLSGSTLKCIGVESCYVNLDGISDFGGSDVSYVWKNNNETFSQEKNPKGIWLEQEKNEIEFLVMSGENILQKQDFFVSVHPNQKSKNFKQEPILFEEIISEEKTQKNQIPFTQNFLSLKYDGLRISGKSPLGSKIEIYQNGQKILIGNTDEKGKYRLVSKVFSSGNYSFDTKLILDSGEEIFLENSGATEITQNDRMYWFTTKKSSKTKTIKIPQLIVQAEAASEDMIESSQEEISLGMNILLSIIIALSILFGFAHLLFRELAVYSHRISLSLYQTRFSVKQKINLIL